MGSDRPFLIYCHQALGRGGSAAAGRPGRVENATPRAQRPSVLGHTGYPSFRPGQTRGEGRGRLASSPPRAMQGGAWTMGGGNPRGGLSQEADPPPLLPGARAAAPSWVPGHGVAQPRDRTPCFVRGGSRGPERAAQRAAGPAAPPPSPFAGSGLRPGYAGPHPARPRSPPGAPPADRDPRTRLPTVWLASCFAVELLLHDGGGGPRGSGRAARGTAWCGYIASRPRRRRRCLSGRRPALAASLPAASPARIVQGPGSPPAPGRGRGAHSGLRRLIPRPPCAEGGTRTLGPATASATPYPV